MNELPDWPTTYRQLKEQEKEEEESSSSEDEEEAKQTDIQDTSERKEATASMDQDEAESEEEEDEEEGQTFEQYCRKKYQYKVDPVLNSKIKLFQGDITKLKCDAIVNAANSGLWAGGGICGAVFDAACEWKLTKACKQIIQTSGRVPTGQTRLTRGYELPAKYIMHTVGPMDGDRQDLANAYKSTYDMMIHPTLLDMKPSEPSPPSIRTLAICCISTGIYGFENSDAAEIALHATREWLSQSGGQNASQIDSIIFCVFLQKDLRIYQALLPIFFPVEESKGKKKSKSKPKMKKPLSSKQPQQIQKPSSQSQPQSQSQTQPFGSSRHGKSKALRASSPITFSSDSDEAMNDDHDAKPSSAAPSAPSAPTAARLSLTAPLSLASQQKPSYAQAATAASSSSSSSASAPTAAASDDNSLRSPPLLKKRKSEEEPKQSAAAARKDVPAVGAGSANPSSSTAHFPIFNNKKSKTNSK